MATDRTKKRFGTMPCEGSRCKSHTKNIPVVVFKNAHDTLSYTCDYCDRSPYARADTDQHADWMQDITPFDAPAPVRSPVAAAVAEALPKPKKEKGWLEL